ncbi:large conductance mechanosensitive channel protein MscL [Actinomycetospora sp. NBRC 106375]|uniref:large conductance mechanosensitive channel protein MscL n=1 Tax=Actinomycetospora sp. NBRC 106375 TaxID=3032207 RepID=UPI002556AEFE|nr:large conductance mechanosensitive channel protein MscL [Actinomycetospora sp. NBRC 106375]
MLKGFKDFLLRGNVVDLAVAVVIGAAFTALVTAFTSAFLKPLIQLFSGGGEFAGSFVVDGVVFDYASFINAIITFIITAAVIYFLVVMPLKYVEQRRRSGEEEGPADPTDVELLTEIRDLLREQAVRTTADGSRGDDGRGTAGGAGGRIPQQDR